MKNLIILIFAIFILGGCAQRNYTCAWAEKYTRKSHNKFVRHSKWINTFECNDKSTQKFKKLQKKYKRKRNREMKKKRFK